MRPAQEIQNTIRNMKIEVNPQADKAVLNELLEAQSSHSVGRKEKIMIYTYTLAKPVVAIAVILAMALVTYGLISPANAASTAWGSVLTRLAEVDRVHFIKLVSKEPQMQVAIEGWYADGKTVLRDQKGYTSYDDGKTVRKFDLNKTPLGTHPSPATVGLGLFEHLSRGFLSPNNEQFAQQTPESVGEDFLVYRFSPPAEDTNWLEEISALVGRNSLLPVQIKWRAKPESMTGSVLYIFDYDDEEKSKDFFELPSASGIPNGQGEVILDGEETRIELKGVPGVQAALVRVFDKYDGPADGAPFGVRQSYKLKGGPIYSLAVTYVANDGFKSPTNDLFRLFPNEGGKGGNLWENWPDGKPQYIRDTVVVRQTDKNGVLKVEINCWLSDGRKQAAERDRILKMSGGK